MAVALAAASCAAPAVVDATGRPAARSCSVAPRCGRGCRPRTGDVRQRLAAATRYRDRRTVESTARATSAGPPRVHGRARSSDLARRAAVPQRGVHRDDARCAASRRARRSTAVRRGRRRRGPRRPRSAVVIAGSAAGADARSSAARVGRSDGRDARVPASTYGGGRPSTAQAQHASAAEQWLGRALAAPCSDEPPRHRRPAARASSDSAADATRPPSRVRRPAEVRARQRPRCRRVCGTRSCARSRSAAAACEVVRVTWARLTSAASGEPAGSRRGRSRARAAATRCPVSGAAAPSTEQRASTAAKAVGVAG